MTKCLSQITPHSIQLGEAGREGVKRGIILPCMVSTSLNGFVGITGTVGNAACGLGSHCLVRGHRPGGGRGS